MNPFASHCVHPQRCRFLMPQECRNNNDFPDESQPSILERIGNQTIEFRVSQIVGPHGCGKSTLAYAVATQMAPRFEAMHSVILRAGKKPFGKPEIQWNLDPPFHHNDGQIEISNSQSARRLLIIDGIETVSPLQRRLLVRQFSRQNHIVLLTTHRPLMGIRTLLWLKPNLQQFLQMVQNLQSATNRPLPNQTAIESFQIHRGNYRDAMWELYDHWEQQYGSQTQRQPRTSIQS